MTRMTNGIAASYGVLSRDMTELVRETRPELLCPQRQSPRTRGRIAAALTALIGGAMVTLLAAAHAFAGPVNQASHLAQEHHACAVVLGLDPSEAPYQECVATLDRNLPQTDPPQTVASVRPADWTTRQKAIAACAEIGLAPDSLAYGRCVTDLDQALSDEQQIYR